MNPRAVITGLLIGTLLGAVLCGCANFSRNEALQCTQIYAKEIKLFNSVEIDARQANRLVTRRDAGSDWTTANESRFHGTAVVSLVLHADPDWEGEIGKTVYLLKPRNSSGEVASCVRFGYSGNGQSFRYGLSGEGPYSADYSQVLWYWFPEKPPPGYYISIYKYNLRLDADQFPAYSVVRRLPRGGYTLGMILDGRKLAESELFQ